jgi:glycosyltransferase involved in cell wall biosynthesis
VVSELGRTLFSLYPEEVFATCQQKLWLEDANAAMDELGLVGVTKGAWELPPGSIYHQTFGAFPTCTDVPYLRRVLTLYDLFPLSNPQWFPPKTVAWFRAVRESLRPEDKLVAISHATQQDAVSYWAIPSSSVAVVNLASNILRQQENSGYRTAPELSPHPKEPAFFLSVCTLEPRKNLPRLIQAFFEFLRRTGTNVRLVLAGQPGWDLPEIFGAIEGDERYRSQVIVLGRVEDKDLCDLYRRCLALVYVPLAEGFGLPPLEAMQLGAAVITSDTSSLPEVVGEAALKVDPRSAKAISEAMESLWREEAKRLRLARLGLEQAKKFSWERAAREYRAIYHQLTQ